MSFWEWIRGLTGSNKEPIVATNTPLRREETFRETPANSLIVRPDSMPPDIRELLWFYDGPYKNYTLQATHRSKTKVGDFVIEISFTGAQEPSAIGMDAPITQPTNLEAVPKLPYYPSYMQLEPAQRWIYLNWLKNVDSEVNIGYVFIFYYWIGEASVFW